MSIGAGTGRVKLQEVPRSGHSSAIGGSALAESSREHLEVITPAIVLGALAEARSLSPDDFRRRQQNWLRAHLYPLLTATEILFEVACFNIRKEDADASLQGALFGTLILQSTIEDGVIAIEQCRANLTGWDIGQRGILHIDGMNDEAAEVLFGEDTSAAFMAIDTPIARELARAVVGYALIPRQSLPYES